jgi:hypothetical protein
MAALQDCREGGDGSSYWEAVRLLTVYAGGFIGHCF